MSTTGGPGTIRSGTWPAQIGRARSSGSSLGPPVRTLADASTSGTRTTRVARSSDAVGGRASTPRPGTMCSTTAARAFRFSSRSVTSVPVP